MLPPGYLTFASIAPGTQPTNDGRSDYKAGFANPNPNPNPNQNPNPNPNPNPKACAPEPFDLLGQLPRSKGSPIADKWEKSLSAEKWSERKAAAELILSLTEGQPLLCAGDYSEVAKG